MTMMRNHPAAEKSLIQIAFKAIALTEDDEKWKKRLKCKPKISDEPGVTTAR